MTKTQKALIRHYDMLLAAGEPVPGFAVAVKSLPACSWCRKPACSDVNIRGEAWGNLCDTCFRRAVAAGKVNALGVGKGQVLLLKDN